MVGRRQLQMGIRDRVWTSVVGGVIHASCQLAVAVMAMRQPALFFGAPLLLGLSIVTAVFIGLVCDNLDGPARRFLHASGRR